MTTTINLLPLTEQQFRFEALRTRMAREHIDAILVADFANLFYLTGRVYAGYLYIGIRKDDQIYFVKRPEDLSGDNVVKIRKPEQITESIGMSAPERLGLELDLLSANMASRLAAVFPGSAIVDATNLLRNVRSIKTPMEQQLLTESGRLHEQVYRAIPDLYKPGMTDLDLEIEIEYHLRKNGCLGQFRISGTTMESYMGSVIAGNNADVPCPYDFAMGGAGSDPSLPVGADGTVLMPGMSVMVDLCGNFTGYMTDMTRTFACGSVRDTTMRAHNLSLEICRMFEAKARPGVSASSLYDEAMDIVKRAGYADYFMGHKQKAGFIGHGVGIEINEWPVIAPKSRDILEEGNVIALEPKFVLPGVGALGIENTYIVTATGVKCITNAPEELIALPIQS